MRRPRKETSRLASLLVVVFIALVCAMLSTMACATYVLVLCELGKETKVVICFYTTIILALNALAKIFITTLREWNISHDSSNRCLRPPAPIKKKQKSKGVSKQSSKKRTRTKSQGPTRRFWQKAISHAKKVMAFHTKLMRTVHRISKFAKTVRDLLPK